jgi:hypothetical protein
VSTDGLDRARTDGVRAVFVAADGVVARHGLQEEE